jgi:hypothetical protein
MVWWFRVRCVCCQTTALWMTSAFKPFTHNCGRGRQENKKWVVWRAHTLTQTVTIFARIHLIQFKIKSVQTRLTTIREMTCDDKRSLFIIRLIYEIEDSSLLFLFLFYSLRITSLRSVNSRNVLSQIFGQDNKVRCS